MDTDAQESVYLNPSPQWDITRFYKIEEHASLSPDGPIDPISEPHLLEEILDVLLLINSSYITVHSLYALQESPVIVSTPHGIQYHPAIGDAAGLAQKIAGHLHLFESSDQNDEGALHCSPLDSLNMVDDWIVLWQTCHDLNRYGIASGPEEVSIGRQGASLTAQALSFALQQILDEHYQFVILLESQLRELDQLTVQKLWAHLQVTVAQHQILAQVLRDLRSPSVCTVDESFGARQTLRQGAAILHCIYEHLQSLAGDAKCREILYFALEESSRPYLRMLQLWIYEGRLDDPYEEFLIQEVLPEGDGPLMDSQPTVHRSLRSYWDTSLQVRLERSFSLLRNLEDDILACGKYIRMLQLLRKFCRTDDTLPEDDSRELNESSILLDVNPQYYSQLVGSQFRKVSQELYVLLMEQEQILPKLRLLSETYLMARCDVYVHFLQTAQAALHSKDLDLERLGALFDMAQLQANCTDSKGLLEFFVRPMNLSLIAQAKKCSERDDSFDSKPFSLPALLLQEERITLDWREISEGRLELNSHELSLIGLNTVVGEEETLRYQLIHRYRILLLTVHIHLSHARIRLFKFSNEKFLALVLRSSQLLSKMQSFFQSFNSYVSYRVLRANWQQFEKKVEQAQTIDEFLHLHSEFLETSLNQCLLASPLLLCLMTKTMETALSLARYLSIQFSGNEKLLESMDEKTVGEVVGKHQKGFQIYLRKLEDGIRAEESKLEDISTLLACIHAVV